MTERTFTRIQYYASLLMLNSGTDMFMAMEAAASTALSHPEWDLTEEKTWAEWEAGDE